jgi:hypothetical protein
LYCEQQLPKVEPWQVTPLPQLPLVDTLSAGVRERRNGEPAWLLRFFLLGVTEQVFMYDTLQSSVSETLTLGRNWARWKGLTDDTEGTTVVEVAAVKTVTPLVEVSTSRVSVTDTVGVVRVTLTVTVGILRRDEQKASAPLSIINASITRATPWQVFCSTTIAWAPRDKERKSERKLWIAIIKLFWIMNERKTESKASGISQAKQGIS